MESYSSSIIFSRMYGLSSIFSPNSPRDQTNADLLVTAVIVSKFSFVKNQYISEEAKNLYNALMIRNYKIQQEINAFARHSRIQQQRKLEKKKEQDRLAALQEEHQTPIVIYDSDKDHESKAREPVLRSSLKEYPTH